MTAVIEAGTVPVLSSQGDYIRCCQSDVADAACSFGDMRSFEYPVSGLKLRDDTISSSELLFGCLGNEEMHTSHAAAAAAAGIADLPADVTHAAAAAADDAADLISTPFCGQYEAAVTACQSSYITDSFFNGMSCSSCLRSNSSLLATSEASSSGYPVAAAGVLATAANAASRYDDATLANAMIEQYGDPWFCAVDEHHDTMFVEQLLKAQQHSELRQTLEFQQQQQQQQQQSCLNSIQVSLDNAEFATIPASAQLHSFSSINSNFTAHNKHSELDLGCDLDFPVCPRLYRSDPMQQGLNQPLADPYVVDEISNQSISCKLMEQASSALSRAASSVVLNHTAADAWALQQQQQQQEHAAQQELVALKQNIAAKNCRREERKQIRRQQRCKSSSLFPLLVLALFAAVIAAPVARGQSGSKLR